MSIMMELTPTISPWQLDYIAWPFAEPYASSHPMESRDQHNLIYNELAYDREILAAEFDKCYQSLTGIYKNFYFLLTQYEFLTIHTNNKSFIHY